MELYDRIGITDKQGAEHSIRLFFAFGVRG